VSVNFGNQIELTGALQMWFWRIVSWSGNTLAQGQDEYTSPFDALYDAQEAHAALEQRDPKVLAWRQPPRRPT
jgi:hypothetical protein